MCATVFVLAAAAAVSPASGAPQIPEPISVIRIQAQSPAPTAPEISREILLQRLMTFVADDYLGTGRDDHENRPDLYAESVDYYGRSRTTRAAVMDGKRAYYRKWPQRRYEMIADSLQAKPGAGDSVEITFRYAYRVANGARYAEGIGTTTLGLVLADDGRYQIVKETGGIVRRSRGS